MQLEGRSDKVSWFLETQDVDACHERRFLSPLGKMPESGAVELRRAIEDAPGHTRDGPNVSESTFNVPHLMIPEAHELVRDRRIPDDDSRELTVWFAVGDVIEANGAMSFIPGSHRHGMLEHRDTRLKKNQLFPRPGTCGPG